MGLEGVVGPIHAPWLVQSEVAGPIPFHTLLHSVLCLRMRLIWNCVLSQPLNQGEIVLYLGLLGKSLCNPCIKFL